MENNTSRDAIPKEVTSTPIIGLPKPWIQYDLPNGKVLLLHADIPVEMALDILKENDDV